MPSAQQQFVVQWLHLLQIEPQRQQAMHVLLAGRQLQTNRHCALRFEHPRIDVHDSNLADDFFADALDLARDVKACFDQRIIADLVPCSRSDDKIFLLAAK
jgi:hypothetical protein